MEDGVWEPQSSSSPGSARALAPDPGEAGGNPRNQTGGLRPIQAEHIERPFEEKHAIELQRQLTILREYNNRTLREKDRAAASREGV